MNQPDEIWRKLTVAARHSPWPGDTAAPLGFASRVVARAMAKRWPEDSLIERFAWRALSAAGVAVILVLLTHWSVPTAGASDNESLFNVEDPAAIVLGVDADE